MKKYKHAAKIIFLIFFITVAFALTSTSYGCLMEETKKIDSGKMIIKVENEKYQINWVTENITRTNSAGKDKKYVHISYKSLKNKQNQGSVHITLLKPVKNKIELEKYSSPMKVSSETMIKSKLNTYNYYWKKLRPRINQLVKNSILNKETLKYNETRLFNRTFTNSTNNETLINQYEMNWNVYYYNKTSSIEILKRYKEFNKNKSEGSIFPDEDVRIDKFTKEKLKITKYSYSNLRIKYVGGTNLSIYYEYVKTNLSPKQYYLQVYKKKLENEKIA